MPDGTWTSKTDMPAPSRWGAGAAPIGEQKAYIYGGHTGGGYLRDCDEYDRVGDFWTEKAELPPYGRRCHGGVSLGNDNCYAFAGAADNGSQTCKDNDEYSQASNIWAGKTDLPTPNRQGLAILRLDSDLACVVGGNELSWGGSGVYAIQDNDQYSKANNAWTAKTDVTFNRMFAGAAVVSGYGYIFGGCTHAYNGGNYNCLRYSPADDTWATMTDMPDPPRRDLTAASLTANDSRGYMFGGSQRSSVTDYPIADCDAYDPVGNLWESKPDLPSPARRFHCAAVFTQQEVCLFGGTTAATPGPNAPTSAIADCDEFYMPRVPWIINLSPAHEQTDVPVDSNIMFDVFDAVGVDPNTITVKVGDTYAIIDGVFQPGFTGIIEEL